MTTTSSTTTSTSSTTTSTPSPDLAQLQKAIKDLQSLPTPLKENIPNNNNTTATLQAYQTAKQHYLTQRTTELFLEHLQQYDTRTNTLPLPTLPTARERTALKSRQERVLSDIRATVSNANNKKLEMERGYDQLVEKKEELIQIVEGLERAERQRVMDNQDELDDVTNEEEEGITEEQVQNEQEKLRELQQRKLQLEERLQSVRSEIMTVEEECQRTKGVVNEVRGRTGRLPLDWSGFYTDSTTTTADDGSGDVAMGNDREYIAVQTEIDTLQEKAAELKQSGQFYDGIRELMEELGGVKILSSNAHSDEGKSGFTLTLLLLGSHVLEITLEKGTNEDGGLVVRGARLTTPTTFPMPESRANGTNHNQNSDHNNEDTQTMTDLINQSLTNISFSKIMSQKQTVSITIPPLDDLVTWSHSLEPSQGIRFVLVETMARIRTLDARVSELTYLRAHYAAQVYDIETVTASSSSSSSSSSQQQLQFGGAEQEVVCAINEGITVAMRLSVDCPLVPGSVYVSEMVGVGGWEDEKLNVLKRVVEERRCKGPVEVMEVMVKEIRRRRNEEGWAIPLTPSLPRGRK